jgi:RNA polymerase sigma factor (sigma-70 family)
VTTAKRKTWRFISRRKAMAAASYADDEDAEQTLLQIPDNAPLADAELQKLEQQHQVRAALAQIDERCRKLLTMLFYAPEPPPYSEIAAALGATEGSIGPTRARCLQKMMKLLG